MSRALLLAVVCAASLLTGCVAQSSPPAGGLSPDEESRYAEAYTTAFTDPGGVTIAYVPAAEWGTVIAGCLSAAGHPVNGRGSLSINNGMATLDGGSDPALQVALTTCLAEYPRLPELRGSLNLAQLDYLYDYYRDFLIPCLGAAGYSFSGYRPTREQFVAINVQAHWTPLAGLPFSAFEDPNLLKECPPTPSS